MLYRSAAFALIWIIAMVPANAFADTYHVEFVQSRNPSNKGQYRVAKVSAEMTPLPGGIVGLFRNNDDVGLPNGWSTFLYKPSASRLDGMPLGLTGVGGGRMHVDGWTTGPIKLNYTMLLQHDRFPNDPGEDELAYARDFGVMWTGRALFMEGAQAGNIEVHFEAPKGWTITAPWREDPSNPRHFTATSNDDLLDSAIMAGTQEQLVEPIGAAEARIGLDPAMHDKEAGLVKTLHQSIEAYQTMFRDPPCSNVVILLSAASYTGGGVMGRSISFLIGPDYPDPKDFHHVLSHELFHLWTAQWDRTGVEADSEWLVEGSAEYYSYLSGLRTGRLSDADFLAELSNRYATYLAALKATSIAGAGRTKLQNSESSEAVYSGGMMALFSLDALIRSQSHNRHSLDDAMRTLNEQFKSKRITMESFSNLVVSYGAPKDFVQRFIKERQPLPLAQVLSSYGLELGSSAKTDGVPSIRFSRHAPQTEMWKQYRSAPIKA